MRHGNIETVNMFTGTCDYCTFETELKLEYHWAINELGIHVRQEHRDKLRESDSWNAHKGMWESEIPHVWEGLSE